MNIIIICYLIIAAFLAGEHYADKVKVEKPGSRDWREEILVMFMGSTLWALLALVCIVIFVSEFITVTLKGSAYWQLITRRPLTKRHQIFIEQLVIVLTIKKNKTLLEYHRLFLANLLLKYNKRKP